MTTETIILVIFVCFFVVGTPLLAIKYESKMNRTLKRLPYVGTALALAVISIILEEGLMDTLFGDAFYLSMFVLSIVAFYGFVFSIRRLNDIQYSPHYIWLSYVPFINLLFGLFLIFCPSKSVPDEEQSNPV